MTWNRDPQPRPEHSRVQPSSGEGSQVVANIPIINTTGCPPKLSLKYSRSAPGSTLRYVGCRPPRTAPTAECTHTGGGPTSPQHPPHRRPTPSTAKICATESAFSHLATKRIESSVGLFDLVSSHDSATFWGGCGHFGTSSFNRIEVAKSIWLSCFTK